MPDAEKSLQDKYFGHEHVTVIEPTKGWRAIDFQEIWAYRELLWVLTWRDIKVRYEQTVLGASWAVIQPFMQMVIFSIIFGRLAELPSEGFPYPVYVYTALLPWTLFSSAVGTASGSLIGSTHLVSKIYFPRLIIPISSVGVSLVDFLVASTVLIALMVYYGIGLTVNVLAIPILLLLTLMVALGVGIFLSAITVTYRDFRFVVPFMLQFWMYATPVVYAVDLIPEKWQWLLFLNPMAGLIDAFRSGFLGKPFDLSAISMSLLMAVALFFAGLAYFEKVERRFADII